MSDRPSRRRVLAGSALLGTTALAGRLPARRPPLPQSRRTRNGRPRTRIPGATETPRQSNRQTATSGPRPRGPRVVRRRADGRPARDPRCRRRVGCRRPRRHRRAPGRVRRGRRRGRHPVDPEDWLSDRVRLQADRLDCPDATDRRRRDRPRRRHSKLPRVGLDPETYDEPITAAHLATHGWLRAARGTWVVDPDDVRPLPDVLAKEQPARVRPPGEVASYSNYGTSLAGQLVADVAGTSFAEYAEANVFDPLEMTSTTFDQPVPEGSTRPWRPDTRRSRERPSPFQTFSSRSVPPALPRRPPPIWRSSSAHTSRAARSAVATPAIPGTARPRSRTGRTPRRILAPESVDAMHERWFSHHEAVDGVGFGLIEGERNGVRTLEHDGAIPARSPASSWWSPRTISDCSSRRTRTRARSRPVTFSIRSSRYASTTEVEPGDGGEPEADEGALEGTVTRSSRTEARACRQTRGHLPGRSSGGDLPRTALDDDPGRVGRRLRRRGRLSRHRLRRFGPLGRT